MIVILFYGVDFVVICEGFFEMFFDLNNDDGENDNKKEVKFVGCCYYCDDFYVGLSFS